MTDNSTPKPGTAEQPVDSGMSAEAVELAEWAWANLPVGPRKWTSLHTHEKALVCHTIAWLRSPEAALLSALEDLVDWLESNQRTIDGEFSMDELLAPARTAIATARGGRNG